MENTYKSRVFYYKVRGEYALFTDPATKGGGEKYTYQVPTYQAIKAITESIYWKPTITIYVDEIKIMNQISLQTKGIRTPLKGGGNDLNYYTYLKNVEYYVKFHYEWNENRKDLIEDRDVTKHEQLMFRSLDRGGRRDIFLGTRECVGYIERITESDFTNDDSFYKDSKISYGIMFHSFTYPSESSYSESELISNFTNITMDNGCIKFERPDECNIKHKLGKYDFKSITLENIKSVDEEYTEYMEDEVRL